ncbi:hypothetical protein SAMN04488059_10756 [Devosia psychrophila]|uniref:Uncharacterized protein n=1 Tax=Devosia psychrophila TaxID=728005 RepID=A0A1I1KBK5_9HYPH|nr:hypothetical protein SAMN04488059_10756 [Devosia psychrophila]
MLHLCGAQSVPHPRNGTSPFTGEGGRGCDSPDMRANRPPPLIPPRKGEGVDWTIGAVCCG